eukprot:6190070-Pleurochrysis_carterae.AAC.2
MTISACASTVLCKKPMSSQVRLFVLLFTVMSQRAMTALAQNLAIGTTIVARLGANAGQLWHMSCLPTSFLVRGLSQMSASTAGTQHVTAGQMLSLRISQHFVVGILVITAAGGLSVPLPPASPPPP